MKKILVVLAAWMGSRFGGVKQVVKVGENGETLLDYSIIDAIEAGFTDIIYVIRKEIEQDIREIIADKYEDQITSHFVYQEIPLERSKPLGTGHALLVAQEYIDAPCLVINADDYYGHQSMMLAAAWLDNCVENQFAMVWFKLANTLSEYGSVNRGVCRVEDGCLVSVVENLGIARDPSTYSIKNNKGVRLEANDVVSLNFWMFHQQTLVWLQCEFQKRQNETKDNLNAEFFLPSYCNMLIEAKTASCDVLVTPDNWIWITNKEDLEEAKKQLQVGKISKRAQMLL